MKEITFLSAQRRFLWALILSFVIVCCWGWLAHVDIVVSAQGKLTPMASVPIAQPVEGGLVRRILVKDGDLVAAGQALIELDAVAAQESAKATSAEVRSLTLQLMRVDAELTGQPLVAEDSSVLAEFAGRKAAQEALLQEALRHRDIAEAELRTAKERVSKFRELSPVAGRQAAMLESLKQAGFVSEAALNEKLLAKLDNDGELAVQERAAVAASAQMRQAQASVEKVRATYRQQLTIERNDLLLRLKKAEAASKQAAHRADLQVLRAPVAGRVTGLTVFSAGRVVAAGETLVSLVPELSPLQFEGWLRNEDAAFVAPGMPVRVKLAAYPFQKYGWLEGELIWLGVDAETPASMKNAQGEPLFYRARVKLSDQGLATGGHPFELRAGLQGVGDVHVGTRTIFEYLTSPLRKVVMEAAREH